MDTLPEDMEVLWGLYPDDTIGDQVKVAVVATGFDKAREQKDAEETSESIKKLWEIYYPTPKPVAPNGNGSEAEVPEDEPDGDGDDDGLETEEAKTGTGWKEKGLSWFNSFKEFVKTSLEEE